MATVTSIRDLAATARGRRHALQLNQTEVARRAGVSRQWVSEFETGKPTAELRLVLRLLDALELALSIDVKGTEARSSRTSATQAVDLDA